MESLDLFAFFVDHFRVSNIYKYGWEASQYWMASITGVLLILALGLRSLEEKVSLMQKGKNNMTAFIVTACLVAVGVVVYHLLVTIIIDFFNAIYSNLGSNDNLVGLGRQLDALMSQVQSKEYSFDFSEVINGAYFIFAMVIYSVTYGILVMTVVFMRLAHAILVTFAVFWGSVALPMSITTGFKMLAPLKTISLTVLIWPIVDAFFMFLVSSVFYDALVSAGADAESLSEWNLGIMLFYLAVFSIMNLLLTATTLSAPFISQGLANGSGNITGMVTSFAGAALAGGAIAGKYMTKGLDNFGTKKMNDMGAGLRNGANGLGAKLNNPTSSSTPKFNIGSKLDGNHNANLKSALNTDTPVSSSVKNASSGLSPNLGNTNTGDGSINNLKSSLNTNDSPTSTEKVTSPNNGNTSSNPSSNSNNSNELQKKSTVSHGVDSKPSQSGDSDSKDSPKSTNTENLSTPKSINKALGELESSSSINKAGATTGEEDLESHDDQLENNQDGDEQAKEAMERKAAKDRKGAIINQNLKKKGKQL